MPVLSSLLITLREGLEAALLVGIVLALLVRGGAAERTRSLWAGVTAAVAVSLAAGAVLFATGAELEGAAEQGFEAVAMLAAAAILTWMILWMRRQARTLSTDMEGRVKGAISGGGTALFWLGFAIVAREGLETALFLFAAVGEHGGLAEVAGALTGLAVALAIGGAAYRGGLRLDLRKVFTVLNVVLLAFAGYLVWGAVEEVGELVGGDAAEIAGPLVAVAYGATMIWLYLRGGQARRATDAHVSA
jgi:high-affinity iron transporter